MDAIPLPDTPIKPLSPKVIRSHTVIQKTKGERKRRYIGKRTIRLKQFFEKSVLVKKKE
jgi:hypothetical protein